MSAINVYLVYGYLDRSGGSFGIDDFTLWNRTRKNDCRLQAVDPVNGDQGTVLYAAQSIITIVMENVPLIHTVPIMGISEDHTKALKDALKAIPPMHRPKGSPRWIVVAHQD